MAENLYVRSMFLVGGHLIDLDIHWCISTTFWLKSQSASWSSECLYTSIYVLFCIYCRPSRLSWHTAGSGRVRAICSAPARPLHSPSPSAWSRASRSVLLHSIACMIRFCDRVYILAVLFENNYCTNGILSTFDNRERWGAFQLLHLSNVLVFI